MRLAAVLTAVAVIALLAPLAVADDPSSSSGGGSSTGCWIYDPSHNPQYYWADPCPSGSGGNG